MSEVLFGLLGCSFARLSDYNLSLQVNSHQQIPKCLSINYSIKTIYVYESRSQVNFFRISYLSVNFLESWTFQFRAKSTLDFLFRNDKFISVNHVKFTIFIIAVHILSMTSNERKLCFNWSLYWIFTFVWRPGGPYLNFLADCKFIGEYAIVEFHSRDDVP